MNGQPVDFRQKAMALLTRQEQAAPARLRLYIGAAPGVGKTYRMLEEAHLLKRQSADIIIGFIEPHGRADTEALIGDLEQVPLKIIDYRNVQLKELDVDAIIARRPQMVIVDELADTNVPGSRHH